jgi:quinolinate synthase
MVKHARQSPAKTFIVATENGILHRMRKDNPEKLFLPASEHATCHHMQRNTLDKLLWSLATLQHPITVEPALARRALVPIERMLALS